MGADSFINQAKGSSAEDAFHKAKAQAEYDYGHAGYTGTIAEKSEFVLFTPPEGVVSQKEIVAWAESAQNHDTNGDDKLDEVANDKWGPAAAVKLPDGSFLFFGWASS